MKTIGIIGAMQLEIDLLIEKIDSLGKDIVAGFTFYRGKISDVDVVITCCGVGKVNSASCTQILIDRYHVDCIINTGVAGGLHRDVKICDIVISSDVTHHDVDKNQMRQLFPFQETFQADEYLVDLALRACKSLELKQNYHHGRIVSGECFVEDVHTRDRIINEFSPYCVEMEGSAIGHVAYMNQIPFVVIRCISDTADEESSTSYEAFKESSANQSASLVIEMLKIVRLI